VPGGSSGSSRFARQRPVAPPRELLEKHPGPLVTTTLVMTESGWLIDRQLGPASEAALYESAAAGEIADQHLGGVDSSRIAIAERLGASSIGTLDRRNFGIVRPQHITGFEHFHNTRRRHSALGMLTPAEVETNWLRLGYERELARTAPTAADIQPLVAGLSEGWVEDERTL
jgi:hypothetical protein